MNFAATRAARQRELGLGRPTVMPGSAALMRNAGHSSAIEAAELQHLYEANMISNTTRRRIQRELDLEDASLRARD
ncbi:hypothetical protein [Kitasatospora aureofaciens]|uniref:hypothetical protein n=1 Tax=Kitasatospora aureofaciens TaxID=1894 RepID=UPI0036F4A51F